MIEIFSCSITLVVFIHSHSCTYSHIAPLLLAPQVWCLQAMVGDDVDFTYYSWTYFEAGQNGDALSNIHEAFIRWSLLMKRAPIPTLLYAGDGYAGDLSAKFKQCVVPKLDMTECYLKSNHPWCRLPLPCDVCCWKGIIERCCWCCF